MQLELILILVIIGLIFIIILLTGKLNSLHTDYDTLKDNCHNFKKTIEYQEHKLCCAEKQINIYEKLENEKQKIICKYTKEKLPFEGKRALVGDYYEPSYMITVKVLQSLGLIVDIVHSGKDIVDKIKNGYKCDIIFTNNVYEGEDSGERTLRSLKEIEGFNIPVIIHTVSRDKKKYFVNNCGFDDYIEKPLDKEKLKPILSKFLKKKKGKK